MMKKRHRILGIIPARGSSKSIPKKNIAPLLGKPLISYTIEEALKSRFLTKLIVSSDDDKVIKIAKKYGAEVPFKRPKELAEDTTPTLPVVQHVVKMMEGLNKITYDWIVLMHATTPLKTVEDIDNAIQKAIKSGADSVASVVRVLDYHPMKMKKIENDRLVEFSDELAAIRGGEMVRRQDLPPAYIRNDCVYVTKRDVLMKENSFFGKDCRPYIMPEERSYNIHEKHDLLIVDALMKAMRKGKFQRTR
ncbi:MAG: acylneuraminate cytidylyltransferase family protein [Hadesarchaea archaeon]|nr:acylneuraminate cytidylyltransferase family protein [Hadesarchaea archaeon]